MKRKIHFSDNLEERLAAFLDSYEIKYTHESENKRQGLDFYLQDYGVYIEIKQYHTERVAKQLASQDEVILIQGKKALSFFIDNFKIK